jgi:alanine racemase
MLISGRRAPIVGRVCMDQTMLDVGHIPDVDLEDEVVIFGRQEDESITVDEIAATLNTINYEIVSSLTARVPKIYPKLS